MQESNCAKVSWNPSKDNQPQCLCFGSCAKVSQVDGETGWTTHTYVEATRDSPATPVVSESSISGTPASGMQVGRCEGNGYSQLGFGGMDKNKCFQRVQESMQVSNCASVSWHPNQDNQPQCLCFGSCDVVSQPQGESGWETYAYDGTSDLSASSGPAAICTGLVLSVTAAATVF